VGCVHSLYTGFSLARVRLGFLTEGGMVNAESVMLVGTFEDKQTDVSNFNLVCFRVFNFSFFKLCSLLFNAFFVETNLCY
jgi:hypothetical protein